MDVDEVGEGDQPDVEIGTVRAKVGDGVLSGVMCRRSCHLGRGGWVSTRGGLGGVGFSTRRGVVAVVGEVEGRAPCSGAAPEELGRGFNVDRGGVCGLGP